MLDANVLISYLLAPKRQRTISTVVQLCLTEPNELVMPMELIQEVLESVTNSSYLRLRIPIEEAELFLQTLTSVADVPAPLEESFPEYAADPDDDYLIAYGLFFEVDYLVTGDAHLLTLGKIEGLQMLRPRDFLDFLDVFDK